jgi:hypothetical protein
MSCIIYQINIATIRSKPIGSLEKHTMMNSWIKANGCKEYVYEIWKNLNLHSSWCWKEKKGRWGKMSTPIKKKPIIEENWGLLFQKK